MKSLHLLKLPLPTKTCPRELERSRFCSRFLITMHTLLGLFICFVLVNTGTSLECEVCVGVGPSCVGEMETCKDGKDTCAVILSDNSLDGYTSKSIVKSCAYSRSCTDETQYVEYGEISQRAGIACCQGDSCRTAIPELSRPLNITQRNGKQCPSCFSLLSSTCREDEMVECLGAEDHCIDLESSITYGPIALKMAQKGCVTKGLCADLSLSDMKVNGIHAKLTKAMCKEATPMQPSPM
ncbi:phospholipase A2 inhibitor and Ly6/PLAUR domain-containing protein-like [Tiliqua scincoides]|uniref:phospholipase A2 inhibitor and Ly6/PLAUR domain-containing protein-like n=1 Tax=Tiliqua scincoides TaxID=71010 RepID=UPI0034635F76